MKLKEKLQLVEILRSKSLRVGNFNKVIDNYFNNLDEIAKDIYNSNRIEGSTITLSDTKSYLKDSTYIEELYNKYVTAEVAELQGLENAVEFLYGNLDKPLTEEFIQDLHYELFINYNEAGSYRNTEVGRLRQDNGKEEPYLSHVYVPEYMEELIEHYNSKETVTLEDICEFKLEFIHIHPFADGNGRVSRLLLNYLLIKEGYLPVTILSSEREEYIETLMKFGDSNWNNIEPFTELICDYLIKAYNTAI